MGSKQGLDGQALDGQTVVVTRARTQACSLVELLERHGATVIAVPSIVIEALPMPDVAADGYDAVILTSVNAARAFFEVCQSVDSIRFACVGSKTASLVADYVSSEIIVPDTFRGEALAAAIGEALGSLAGRRFLLPQAEQARGAVTDGLRAHGATVDEVVVYRTVAGPKLDAPLPPVDIVTFLSGRTIECFLEIVPNAASVLTDARVAVIGPVAAAAAERLGVRVDVVAAEATVESLVSALT